MGCTMPLQKILRPFFWSSTPNEKQKCTKIIGHSAEPFYLPVVTVTEHLDQFHRPEDLAHLLHLHFSKQLMFHCSKNKERLAPPDAFQPSPCKLYHPDGRIELRSQKPAKKLIEVKTVDMKRRRAKLIWVEDLQQKKTIIFVELKCTSQFGGISRWRHYLGRRVRKKKRKIKKKMEKGME